MVFFAILSWMWYRVLQLAGGLATSCAKVKTLVPRYSWAAWMTPVRLVCVRLVTNAIRGAPPGCWPQYFCVAPWRWTKIALSQLQTSIFERHPAVLISARSVACAVAGQRPGVVRHGGTLRPRQGSLLNLPASATAYGTNFAQH
jgi:hypothetical protein